MRKKDVQRDRENITIWYELLLYLKYSRH